MTNVARQDPQGVAELRAVVGRLVGEVETLSALVLSLGHRSGDVEVPAAILGPVENLMADVAPTIDGVDPGTARSLGSLARAMLVQAAGFASAPAEPSAWTVTDPVVLQSLGQGSAALAPAIRRYVVPRFDGLLGRLAEPSGAILDVGVGVGALAIAFAAEFPMARVVGLDVWEPALALAATNVLRSGVSDRIRLLHRDVCEFDEHDTFDLAWFAGPFVPESAHSTAFRRVHAALRPGGVIIYGAFGGGSTREAALADLRTLRSGGPVLTDDEIALRLRAEGFEQVETVGADIGLPARFVAALRR